MSEPATTYFIKVMLTVESVKSAESSSGILFYVFRLDVLLDMKVVAKDEVLGMSQSDYYE
jgi:hypothetical protein